MTAEWTPVALARDLPPGVVMPATVSGTELAVWRSATGRVAAWSDRCPHRGMRLSHGFVRGEALSCIYHGWSYGAQGQCLRIPAHPDLEPPEAIKVPTFHATEAGGVIWVATDAPPAPPPAVSGQPLRSLAFDAMPDLAAYGLHLSGQIAKGDLSGVAVTVLVQPLPMGRCVLHVLTGPAAQSSALAEVSRDLEAMRRQAEGAFA